MDEQHQAAPAAVARPSRGVVVAPSILSADFTRLGEQVAQAESAGADRVQVDVMDGRFVPNITVGPLVVEAVRRSTRLPIETEGLEKKDATLCKRVHAATRSRMCRNLSEFIIFYPGLIARFR